MLELCTFRQLEERLIFAFDDRNPHHSGVLKCIYEVFGIAVSTFFAAFLLWLILMCLLYISELILPIMPSVVTIIHIACTFLIYIYLISTLIMFTMLILLFFVVPYYLWYALPSHNDVIAFRVY